MPRLDATRLSAWRMLQSRVAEIERRVDEDLRDEWDIPLNWFDVLAALQRLGARHALRRSPRSCCSRCQA